MSSSILCFWGGGSSSPTALPPHPQCLLTVAPFLVAVHKFRLLLPFFLGFFFFFFCNGWAQVLGMLRKYSTMGYTFSLSSLCSVFLVLGIELSTSPTVCLTTETYHQPSSVSNSSPHQLFIYLFYKLFSVICMDILAACTPHVYPVPTEARREQQLP